MAILDETTDMMLETTWSTTGSQSMSAEAAASDGEATPGGIKTKKRRGPPRRRAVGPSHNTVLQALRCSEHWKICAAVAKPLPIFLELTSCERAKSADAVSALIPVCAGALQVRSSIDKQLTT